MFLCIDVITRMAAHETAVATQVWRDTLATNFPSIDVTVEDALKVAGIYNFTAVFWAIAVITYGSGNEFVLDFIFNTYVAVVITIFLITLSLVESFSMLCVYFILPPFTRCYVLSGHHVRVYIGYNAQSGDGEGSSSSGKDDSESNEDGTTGESNMKNSKRSKNGELCCWFRVCPSLTYDMNEAMTVRREKSLSERKSSKETENGNTDVSRFI